MAQTVNGTINQDLNPIFQPQGSTRFCLNGILEAEDGMQGSMMNEEGNRLCIDFENEGYLDYDVIGAHRLNDDEVLLFMTNGTNSVIGKQMKNCTFELLINADCLNFQKTKRITALSRTFNGCERTVYFTDSFNSYRSINIDNLQRYLLAGETIDTANASGTGWNCDLIKHFFDYEFPILDLVSVNDTGGNLLLGMYTFSVRYLDEDGNATNWIPFSNPIPVTQGFISQDLDRTVVNSYNDNWNAIQGGINLREDQGTFVGQILPTNKSITLEASNLDPSFNTIQFAVTEYVEDLKIPTNYYILETVIYSGSSVNYTYRGFNSNIHSAASEAELTIPTIAIDTVHTHAQIDNRLFLANVTEFDRNWAEFQQAACKIKSKWLCQAQDNYTNLSATPITKRPEYYWANKSYMRDEIYAFAIVYVFNDGSLSPPFHIPGTAADNPDRDFATFQANNHNRQNGGTLVDREILTVVNTPASQVANEVALADVRHLGLNLTDTVERWKVFNTAIMTTYTSPYPNAGSISHTGAEGEMAFWEAENSLYPEFIDCNGDSVFGEDAWGDTLAGTPIRHHKFPDSTLIEHAFTARTIGAGPTNLLDDISEVVNSRLGIEFSNVTFPATYASEIQGYYIVRNHRTDFNSTVVDKGHFNPPIYGEIPGDPGNDALLLFNAADGLSSSGTAPADAPEGCLLSSLSLQGKWDQTAWARQAAKGDFLKFENVCYANYPGGSWRDSYFNDVLKPAVNVTSRQIVDSILVASNRVENGGVGFTYELFNGNYKNDANFISLTDTYPTLAQSNIGDVPQFRQSYYVAVKRYLPDNMGDLSNIVYYKCHDDLQLNVPTTSTIYGGDVFINNFTYVSLLTNTNEEPMPQTAVSPRMANDTRQGTASILMWEEPINLALRHYGNEAWEKHPQLFWQDATVQWRGIPQHPYSDDIIDPETDIIQKQWKGLNPDYHVENELNDFFALPRNQNWCDKCEGRKPNYVYYSDQSSAFEITDNYRVFRALNVSNIFPEDGSISKLYVNKDRLFATTEDSIVFLPVKPQTLQGDGTTVFTGTADVLSAPPKKLVSSDIGYAGVQDKFSIVTTEFGTVLVDSVRGKVFLHDQQLTEISNQGLRNWFRDNSKFNISRYIINYPLESHYTNINGFGFNAAYDPKYRRLIIHKKDYYPIVTFGGELPDVPAADTLYYSIGANGQITWEYNSVEVFDSNPLYFANTSWTISYSFVHKGWASWHSYMPNFMWSTSDTFFTFATNLANELQGTYQHNYIYEDQANFYQTYYGTKFDHIIEIVAKPNIQTGVYPETEYKSNCFLTAPLKQSIPLVKTTFDQAWLYSRTQSSDYMDMITYNANQANPGFSVYNNSPSNNELPVRRAEVNWRFNKYRDIAISGTGVIVDSQTWNNLQVEFNQVNGYQGFIDRVPNPPVHDPTVNQWERSRFRDDYMFVRLFTNKENDDVKFVTDIIASTKYPSIR